MDGVSFVGCPATLLPVLQAITTTTTIIVNHGSDDWLRLTLEQRCRDNHMQHLAASGHNLIKMSPKLNGRGWC